MTERIDVLKNDMLLEERYLSIEQARIITRIYRENESDSIVMKRAKSLKASLEEMEIDIHDKELIVGNRTKGVRAGVVFPEGGLSWLHDEINEIETRPQDRFKVRLEDIEEFKNDIYPYWKGKTLEDYIEHNHGDFINENKLVAKINQTDHAQGHIIPDVTTWLEKGPQGIKEEADKKLIQATGDKKEFYESISLVMEGAINFYKRYHKLVKARLKDAKSEDYSSLNKVCEAIEHLIAGPPQTFLEAVQASWFLFVILQMESNASSFSPGRMDQYLYPFYEKDIRENRLTEESALEIIQCLFLKFNQIVYMRSSGSAKYFAGFPIGFNIALSGSNDKGDDMTNELSFLFLESQYKLGLPQPNLSVRLHKNTPDEFLRKAVKVVSKGSGMPQFFNDEAIIDTAIETLSIEPKDAYNYGIVGCVELTTQGNSLGWSDAAMFNLNKALEYTLTGGIDLLSGEKKGPDYGKLTDYDTFEDLELAYDKMIDYYVDRMLKACEYVEQAHIKILPTSFLSGVIDSCMSSGIDVTAGGAKYNLSGIQMIQIANVTDSLAVLKTKIFDKEIVSRSEMLDALESNYDGYDILRHRLLNKVPKYGNDIEWVDELGAKWARTFAEKIKKRKNYRGGPYHTGMYTVSAHVPMGQNVGASPDGRYAKEPLADGGLSPMYGRDLQGPTAVLKSVSKLDNELTTNGGLLNMKFLPSFFETEEGISKFMIFLRSFVDLEIPHIQFNVVNKEQLVKAKKHPDQYKGLTVRVAGYTAYFVELASDLQDEIIARTAYADI